MKLSATAIAMGMIFMAVDLFSQVTAPAHYRALSTTVPTRSYPTRKLALVNKATGFQRTAASTGDGTYVFSLIPAGTYRVTVRAPGFASAQFSNVELQVGVTTQRDATLSAGTLEQAVTVEAQLPQIDTAKTEVGMSVTPAEVQGLPLNGRDFANLAFLAPGVKPVNSYDPTKNRVAAFATDGSAGRNVNVTVNGIDDKDNTVGGPVMQLPLEAVEEFNISTQRFSAANGRTSGSTVNLITKSGNQQLSWLAVPLRTG